MAYSLGIDASTQSVSAIVIDLEDGNIVCNVSINFGEALPHYEAPNGFFSGSEEGEVFSNPRMWLDALDLLLTQLSKECDLGKIKCLSGAGQQHGSVYLNHTWHDAVSNLFPSASLAEQLKDCLSRPVAPIWMDSSSELECQEIAQALGGDRIICEQSGSVATERFTGPQIRRFYKRSLEAYLNTDRIHLVSSFFCSLFAGCDAPIDTGDGAGMNLMNLQSFDWDAQLLNATAPDLKNKLPSIVTGNHTVGTIAPYFVEKYGFDPKTEITVFTGDNPSSLVGTGGSSEGKVVISLGTSDTYFAAMPKIVSDPNGYGHVFGNPSGKTMSLQCFLNGSLAREAVKDRFNYSWDQFTEALDATEAGANGNYMLPFFSPEISPRYSGSTPILKGNHAFQNWERPQEAVRACVEGQFLNMQLHTEWMAMQPRSIYLTGGASENDSIAQVAADIFQCTVERLEITGSVALGGAMRAAKNSLGHSLQSLEDEFCKKRGRTLLHDRTLAPIYEQALSEIASMLIEL